MCVEAGGARRRGASQTRRGQQATKQTYAQERRRKTTVAQDTRKDNINIKSRRSLAKLQRVDGFLIFFLPSGQPLSCPSPFFLLFLFALTVGSATQMPRNYTRRKHPPLPRKEQQQGYHCSSRGARKRDGVQNGPSHLTNWSNRDIQARQPQQPL